MRVLAALLLAGCGAATEHGQRAEGLTRLPAGAYSLAWPDAGALGSLTIEASGSGWWGAPVCLPSDVRASGCAYYALSGESRAAGLRLDLTTDSTSRAGAWSANLRVVAEDTDAGGLVMEGRLTGDAAPGVPGTVKLEFQQ